ncbi:MAG: hypothetical protein P8Y82_01810, partial [Methyloceanibacter sp.]
AGIDQKPTSETCIFTFWAKIMNRLAIRLQRAHGRFDAVERNDRLLTAENETLSSRIISDRDRLLKPSAWYVPQQDA